MSAPAQQRQQQTTTQQQPDRNAALLAAMLDKEVAYKPFLSEQTMTLTPRLVLRFLATPTKSGKLPTVEQAAKFCRLCQARQLNPWEGDAFLVGYDGKDGPVFSLITAHQAFLKRAEVHPEYDGMESGVIVRRGDQTIDLNGDYFEEDDRLVGGWAKVFFKSRSHPMTDRLRLATFSTGRSRWEKDPSGMIVKCAESSALRKAFPNSLGGMYLDGEMGAEEQPRSSEPPVGRSKLNGNGQRPVNRIEEQMPEEPPMAPEPPPERPATDPSDNLDAVLEDALDANREAKDMKRLNEIYREMTKRESDLGPNRWQGYLDSYKAAKVRIEGVQREPGDDPEEPAQRQRAAW